jgi:hypothetical protein
LRHKSAIGKTTFDLLVFVNYNLPLSVFGVTTLEWSIEMNKRLSVFFAFLALLISTLACNLVTGSPKEAGLENLRMAFDEDGNNPTTVFSPSDVFYAVGDLKNAPADTVVEAKWLAEQIEGYDSGELIYEQTINDFTDESFSGSIYFQLSNDSGWPVGDYQVDVYMDGNFIQSIPFSVR